jgi:hypothetical protein
MINLSYPAGSLNTGLRRVMIQLAYHISYHVHQMGRKCILMSLMFLERSDLTWRSGKSDGQ